MRTTARMPTIEEVSRGPLMTMPSQRIEPRHVAVVDLGAGQEAGVGVDRVVGVVEVERRQRRVRSRLAWWKLGIVPMSRPVAVVREGEDAEVVQRRGDDLLAEVGRPGAADEQRREHLGPEDVDAHAGEQRPRAASNPRRVTVALVEREGVEVASSCGFSTNSTTRPSRSRRRMPKPLASSRVTGLTAIVRSASWLAVLGDEARRCPSGRAGRRRGSGPRRGRGRRSRGRFWRTASAVPWYQSRFCRLCSAARMLTNPPRKTSKR